MELRWILMMALAGCSGFTPAAGPPLVATALVDRLNLAQDVVVGGGFAYWVEQGTFSQSARDGKVTRVPVAGCAGAADCPHVMADNLYSPGGVTLSLDGKSLFYCELADPKTPTSASGRIWQMTLGPSETPQLFAANQGGPRKLAADQTALYWVNGSTGELRRAWLDGGSADGAVLLSGENSPVELTLGVTTQTVYFTNYGNGADFDGSVVGADVDGNNAHTVGKAQDKPRGLSVGPTYVYWANAGNGTVMRATPDGRDVAAFASDRLTPNDVLVDGDWLYVAEGGSAPYFTDGRIVAMKLDGTSMVTLADMQAYPRSLASDATAVYWVNAGTDVSVNPADLYNGSLMRVKKP